MADAAPMTNYVPKPGMPQPGPTPKVGSAPPMVAAMAKRGSAGPNASAGHISQMLKLAAAASAAGQAIAARGTK